MEQMHSRKACSLGLWFLVCFSFRVAIWAQELEKRIQTVLFGENEVEYGDFCRKNNYYEEAKEELDEWIRRKCDVLALWSHIWYDGDIFVTRDNRFFQQTRKPRLIELGAGRIMRPKEVVGFLDC